MIKLVVLPAIFLPIAIKLGFRDQALVALIIMLGSPTTPSSYIMAKNGARGCAYIKRGRCNDAYVVIVPYILDFCCEVLRIYNIKRTAGDNLSPATSYDVIFEYFQRKNHKVPPKSKL